MLRSVKSQMFAQVDFFALQVLNQQENLQSKSLEIPKQIRSVNGLDIMTKEPCSKATPKSSQNNPQNSVSKTI